jgi:glucosamine-6-phosphate deaminase
MHIIVSEDPTALGRTAAVHAADRLRAAIAATGRARIIAATGAAQFAFLSALTQDRSVDWSKVEMFHLDEYVGLRADHPASFRKFLTDRLIEPTGLGQAHLLDGERDPETVCREMGELIQAAPIDLAFVGIGENAHLAFNDPPADFQTDRAYLLVQLDTACRQQQVGEGWFATLADVPTHALSMSVRQILETREIIAIVPEARKANAVQGSLEGEVTPMVPASILRTHPHVTVYLDRASSARLAPETLSRFV